jgi:hypothetical protein
MPKKTSRSVEKKDPGSWRISNNLVRLVLLRVLPGREVEIGRLLEKGCRKIGVTPDRFRVFRLFGSYDLAFIQDGCDFRQAELMKLGTIPGVTGSTEYVCYSWMRGSSKSKESFKIARISKPLLGLCFLKINPLLTQKYGLEPEIKCVEHLAQQDKGVQVLGTLGWSEILLVVSDASLKRILERSRSYFPTLTGWNKSLAEKTLTILGLSLDVSDPKKSPMVVPLEPELLRKKSLEVHFSASCAPNAMTRLQKYAAKHFKLETTDARITFRLGARDLDFEIPLKGVRNLNELIARMDEFRANNADVLIRTHTELQYRMEKKRKGASKPAPRASVMLKISPKEAELLINLGPEGASVLAAVYHFNHLLQNRLLLDTFVDMGRAVTQLRRYALKLARQRRLSIAARWRLATRLQYLQQAVSQRYQSAYVGIEENPWGASFGIQSAGVGVQRILKALEYYALKLLVRLGKEWSGYVVIGRHYRPAMEHFQDILLVPVAEGLDAARHWAFSHEVMHILQHYDPDNFSLASLATRSNSVPKEATRSGKLLIEAGADIMEFRLSCTLPLKEYLRIVWSHLQEGLFINDDQLTSYLIRSFAVYYSVATKYGQEQASEKETDELFTDFISFIRRCSTVLSRDVSRLRVADERGQQALQLTLQEFKIEVKPHLSLINKRVTELGEKISDEARREEINDNLNQLEKGWILGPEALGQPDAIAWGIVSRGLKKGTKGSCEIAPSTARETIAWILSLWHAYHVLKRVPDVEKEMQRRQFGPTNSKRWV